MSDRIVTDDDRALLAEAIAKMTGQPVTITMGNGGWTVTAGDWTNKQPNFDDALFGLLKRLINDDPPATAPPIVPVVPPTTTPVSTVAGAKK